MVIINGTIIIMGENPFFIIQYANLHLHDNNNRYKDILGRFGNKKKTMTKKIFIKITKPVI